MKSKMIVDNYESASKARPRTSLLNEAFSGFPEMERPVFDCVKARSGFSIWAEYNSENYMTQMTQEIEAISERMMETIIEILLVHSRDCPIIRYSEV